MAADEKWYFTKEQLLHSPSRKSGYDVDKELSCRQQAANFIQDMGQKLQVSQLCINTAIVYMHRFYVFHSLASFHRNAIAAAALFLAAKVEEQPRKLEHVIKVAHICLHREHPNLDTKSEVYLEQAQDLVFNENVLLQTLGFDVAIDHPHTHVVRCCHLVRASKDLAQTSYFMASNSLHLTTMCLQYKPTVVACFCIHLACKWSNWEIPRSNEGKDWFWYVDKTVTLELLEQLTGEFLVIFDKCPTKLKRKMMSMNQNNSSGFTQQSIPHDGLQFEEPRKLSGSEAIKPPEGLFPVQKQNSQLPNDKPSTSSVSSSSTSSSSSSSSSTLQPQAHHQKIDYREYREKKERERLEREKQQHHHHHHQQQQQSRDGHSSVSSSSHHHSKGPMTTKGPPNVQSRSSSSSSAHKGYQQQPHMQQNVHFQSTKENVDNNSGQNFQSTRDVKDNNYLKQHPPHTERDSSKDINYLGQYSQASGIQHQNYSHKPESSYSHRDSSRTNHGSSNMTQAHHGQSHNSSNQNLLSSQREYGAVSQREGISVKDGADGQSQSQKKDMSSSIRDIISQTLPQSDTHSMTNERKDVREKNRPNYVYSSGSMQGRSEVLRNGREQAGKVFHDPNDKKVEDFSSRSKERIFKKEEDEPVIDTKKIEPLTPIKAEKFDESDSGENYSGGNNNWNYDFGMNLMNAKAEKKESAALAKTDTTVVKAEVNAEKSESAKPDLFSANMEVNASKSQAVHPMRGMYDSKYKGHHNYPPGNKSSDASQFKNEKSNAQCSSDLTKKFNDKMHEKLRKSDPDRVSYMSEAGPGSDIPKHHKMSKDAVDKHKVLMPGQQMMDQKIKDRSSPSKYSKIKSVQRPSNLDYVKSDSSVHFGVEAAVNSGSSESDRNEKNLPGPTKTSNSEDSIKGMGNFQKQQQQQKSHDFGVLGGLATGISDSNLTKTSKTSSIFSPDSKIPPQNILSSLEKDSKKSGGSAPTHRTHTSSKSSPTSTPASAKANVPTAVTVSNSGSVSTGSLFSPPLPKSGQVTAPRHRTSSSGSEPELIPAANKMEDAPSYDGVATEKKAPPATEKASAPERESSKSGAAQRADNSGSSLFDFDLKSISKDGKSTESKAAAVRGDASQFPAKQSTSMKLPSEIRSDLGAVIYPNNPKTVPATKPSQTFNLNEPKLTLVNSVSTVNLSGIEKMVDTSISPAKPPNPFGTPTSLKSNVGMNLNVSGSSGSSMFASAVPMETDEKISPEQSTSKTNALIVGQDIIDVEDISHPDGKKRSDKKKKKDKHKHKDKDRSERKKEKKKHKEKDKDGGPEKDKHREKDRSKEKHREKEIDVVNSEVGSSEAPIKITIPKDKISGGLKIKISKDCLKKEGGEVDSPKSGTSGELKIKISKDKFSHVGTYKDDTKGGNSRKRERSPKSSNDMPYPKILKTTDKKISSSSSRSNGTEGSSRNSTSHKHSVSENGSYIDISSLYDFPFDFEENGEGIIKTPDYDFEALNSSEYPNDVSALPDDEDEEEESSFFKNSQNESELASADFPVTETKAPTPEPRPESPVADHDAPHADPVPTNSPGQSVTDEATALTTPLAAPAPPYLGEERLSPVAKPSTVSSPVKSCRDGGADGGECLPEAKRDPEKREEGGGGVGGGSADDYVLKNYKLILDSHSRRCEMQSQKGRTGTEGGMPEGSGNESAGKGSRKATDAGSETNNPNYYNKYFKKEGHGRTRLREEKKGGKARGEDKLSRFEGERARFYDKFEPASQRYRNDYADRRDERRHYRDFREYGNPDSQYYFDGNESRRFDYQKYVSSHFFGAGKVDSDVPGLGYDINANESGSVYSQTKNAPQFMYDSGLGSNALDMNMQYQYGFYNNYIYPNGAYRFYGSVPFVNMSLIQQQPTPPGTGDPSVHLGPPPLPLEPPPDLPPPPETPPPKQT